jgi:hypothetical protein
LNAGDFYTFTLGASAITHFNITNIKPGETSNILVNTNTAPTASFSSNVRQPSGSFYVPSPSGSRDILTLISFDTSSVNLVAVNRLI